MGGKSAPPPPAQQQVSQTSEFPEELKPYITDILERSKTRIEARGEEGYVPYPAPRLAEFSPEQLEAQSGIAGIARSGLASDPTLASSRTYMQPALDATQASLGQFNTAAAQQYMSPYMQSVLDIQKREAMRSGDVQRQDIGTQAVGAGGFGGSRQAIQESEQRRNEAQLLNDIQAKGQQSAFETAGAQFERQRGRDLAAGQQFAGLAEQAPRLGLAEMGALSGVGAAQQEQGQRGLDIGYEQFQEELQYPERTLQEYSSIIRGFPLTPNQFSISQTATPAPNLTTQLAGMVGAGAGAFKAFAKEGGQIKRKEGGLADLPTKRYISLDDGGALQKMLKQRDTGLGSYREKLENFMVRQKEISDERESQQDRDIGLSMIQASAPLLAGDKPLMEALAGAAPNFAADIGKLRREERKSKQEDERTGIEIAGLQAGLDAEQLKEYLKKYEIDEEIAAKLAKIQKDSKLNAADTTSLVNFGKTALGAELNLMSDETRNLFVRAVQAGVEAASNGDLESGYNAMSNILNGFDAPKDSPMGNTAPTTTTTKKSAVSILNPEHRPPAVP
jgi:hypothetical protein